MRNRAIILGNGPSRLDFEFEQMNDWATTFGCNAIYRDATPDYLVAMDYQMVDEILTARAHLRSKFYTQHENRMDERANHEPINFILIETDTLDSGNSAIKVAVREGFTDIYLVGFDGRTNRFRDNVYAGTNNYSTAKPTEQDVHNWQTRLRHTVSRFPHVQFTRVTNDSELVINATNYKNMLPLTFRQLYRGDNN